MGKNTFEDLIYLVGYHFTNPGQEKEGLITGSVKACPWWLVVTAWSSENSEGPSRLARKECYDWLMMSALGTRGACSCHEYAVPGVEGALFISGWIRFKIWLSPLRAGKSFQAVYCLLARWKETFQSKSIALAPVYNKLSISSLLTAFIEEGKTYFLILFYLGPHGF